MSPLNPIAKACSSAYLRSTRVQHTWDMVYLADVKADLFIADTPWAIILKTFPTKESKRAQRYSLGMNTQSFDATPAAY